MAILDYLGSVLLSECEVGLDKNPHTYEWLYDGEINDIILRRFRQISKGIFHVSWVSMSQNIGLIVGVLTCASLARLTIVSLRNSWPPISLLNVPAYPVFGIWPCLRLHGKWPPRRKNLVADKDAWVCSHHTQCMLTLHSKWMVERCWCSAYWKENATENMPDWSTDANRRI